METNHRFGFGVNLGCGESDMTPKQVETALLRTESKMNEVIGAVNRLCQESAELSRKYDDALAEIARHDLALRELRMKVWGTPTPPSHLFNVDDDDAWFDQMTDELIAYTGRSGEGDDHASA